MSGKSKFFKLYGIMKCLAVRSINEKRIEKRSDKAIPQNSTIHMHTHTHTVCLFKCELFKINNTVISSSYRIFHAQFLHLQCMSLDFSVNSIENRVNRPKFSQEVCSLVYLFFFKSINHIIWIHLPQRQIYHLHTALVYIHIYTLTHAYHIHFIFD